MMKTYKNTLTDAKIEQFCQRTTELLTRIHEKYANIVTKKTYKKRKNRDL